jgi:hypothetical protein
VRHLRYTALPLAALAACLAAAPADAACAPPAQPALIVERGRDDPVRREEASTLVELTRRSRGKRSDANPDAHTFGLTESTIESRVHVAVEARRAPGGLTCAAPREVRVVVRLVARRVYVAREARGNACVRREVLRHEQRHVALDDAMMPELLASVRRSLAGPVSRLPAWPVGGDAELRGAARRTANELNALVAALPFGEERRARHAAAVDTPAEYARFSRACKGAVGAIIRRAQEEAARVAGGG